MASKTKIVARKLRQRRIRKKFEGSPEQPRLTVFRSSRYIYAQIIEDVSQKTLVACSSIEKDVRKQLKSTRNLEAAKVVGKLLAERAKTKKISGVVFDRAGFEYQGRIKALAEGAREAGLKF